ERADESPDEGTLAEEARLVLGAKRVALLVAGSAVQRFMQALAEEQEVIEVLSNCVIEVYAMESVLLRTLKKIAGSAVETCAVEIDAAKSFIHDAADRIEVGARRALARIAEGDTLRTQVAVLRRFLKRVPIDTIALKRRVADRALELS